MTWYDFTTYYETLPAHKISLAFDMADRMRNIAFKPEEVESSALSSSASGRATNSPLFLLGEEMNAAAYRVHPADARTLGHLRSADDDP